MSDKYHVNPETGNPNKCSAKKSCPFGGDDKHYFSKEAAHAAFESDQGAQISTISRKSKASKTLPEGAENLPWRNGAPFAEAWEERFKNLTEFHKKNPGVDPKSLIVDVDTLLDQPVNVLRDRGRTVLPRENYLKINPDGDDFKGDYVVCVETRQGGGNRECWCDDDDNHESYCLSENNDELTNHPNYLFDADDDFDSTYASFYFAANITKKDFSEFEEKRRSLYKFAGDNIVLEGVKSGLITPWGAVSGEHFKRAEYDSLKSRIAREETEANNAELSNAKIAAAMTKIEKGSITEAEAKEIGVYSYRTATLVRSSRELQVARKKFDEVIEIQKAAEGLPEDNPLRQWAIGAREERSYQTTEKKGRKNVSVTKRYTPKPRLQDDIDEAKRRVDSIKSNIASSLTDTLALKKRNDAAIEKFAENKKKVADLRNEAWAEGWYSDPRELPRIPDSY